MLYEKTLARKSTNRNRNTFILNYFGLEVFSNNNQLHIENH